MGIDVRQYAMANQSFTRASCVGCGLCAHVCPRGVLKLENKPDRFKGGTPIRVYARRHAILLSAGTQRAAGAERNLAPGFLAAGPRDRASGS